MKNKRNANRSRNFVALAAKVRNAGAMGDRRKKRSKEPKNHFDGW